MSGNRDELFVCIGVGIILLFGPARLGPVTFGATPGLAPVRLTGLRGFTPSKSPGSEAGNSDCVGCVGFWFVVLILHIGGGVPGGRENSVVVGLYTDGGGGLNMFTLLVPTKAACGPER